MELSRGEAPEIADPRANLGPKSNGTHRFQLKLSSQEPPPDGAFGQQGPPHIGSFPRNVDPD